MPHSFKNESGKPARMLISVAPAGLERMFFEVGVPDSTVDCNGNGDLAEPDERLEPNNPKDGSNRFANAGSHTHFDIFEFTVRAGATGTRKLRLDHWIRAENFTPQSDFDKKWHAKWLAWRWEKPLAPNRFRLAPSCRRQHRQNS